MTVWILIFLTLEGFAAGIEALECAPAKVSKPSFVILSTKTHSETVKPPINLKGDGSTTAITTPGSPYCINFIYEETNVDGHKKKRCVVKTYTIKNNTLVKERRALCPLNSNVAGFTLNLRNYLPDEFYEKRRFLPTIFAPQNLAPDVLIAFQHPVGSRNNECGMAVFSVNGEQIGRKKLDKCVEANQVQVINTLCMEEKAKNGDYCISAGVIEYPRKFEDSAALK